VQFTDPIEKEYAMSLLLGLFAALVIPALGCSEDSRNTDHEEVDSSFGPSGGHTDSRVVGVDAASHTTEPGGSGGGSSTEVDSGVNSDTGIDSGASTDSGNDASGDPVAEFIPSQRKIDWWPGVRGGIPDLDKACPSNAPSVTEFGAVGDGNTDDYAAFVAAIDTAQEGSAVRIPEGEYLLNSGLVIDKGIILCGEGPDKSRLLFRCDEIAIDIVKYDRGDWVDLASGFTKDSIELTLSDAAAIVPGDFIELQQSNNWEIMDPDNIWRNDSWAPENCVGQMMKVVSIDGETLTVDPPLHIDYQASFDPRIRRVGLVEGVGLQGLYITRLDTNDNATIEMKNAVDCWVRNCESENTFRAHVSTSSALWCEVRDSYLHHAHDYGGGGHGYGTNLGTHTTACLVENNIFVNLRHSMLVQVGATGNVFGYNYSVDPIQSEGGNWTPCDISLHGHYPNMNLFEGNTVQEIDVSDYWGPCGPGNTFFRNRIQSEGIQIMDYSHDQNVLGNELGVDPNLISVDPNVNGTLVHGNFQEGDISWDPDLTEQKLPNSLYLRAKPAFFQDTPWPATGSDRIDETETIPAEKRYLGSAKK